MRRRKRRRARDGAAAEVLSGHISAHDRTDVK